MYKFLLALVKAKIQSGNQPKVCLSGIFFHGSVILSNRIKNFVSEVFSYLNPSVLNILENAASPIINGKIFHEILLDINHVWL